LTARSALTLGNDVSLLLCNNYVEWQTSLVSLSNLEGAPGATITVGSGSVVYSGGGPLSSGTYTYSDTAGVPNNGWGNGVNNITE
jgi:hypothetical protein